MKPIIALGSMLLMAYVLLNVGGASAQTETNRHTFVGLGGNDNDNCGGVSSPCRSLNYGVGKTYAGGQVECLQTPDMAGLNVTKSITIACDTAKWSNTASALSIYSDGTINVSASDTVILRGLRFDGARYLTNTNGLIMTGAGTLVLDDIQITSWTGTGILFRPNGPAKLIISNSLIASNGDPSNNSGAGIRIVPQSGGSAQVNISRTDISRNIFGIAADGSSSSAGINVTVTDSVSTGNALDGVIAISTGAPVGVLLTNVKSTNNGYGARSIGNNVTVRVDNSRFVGNGTGISSASGGATLSGGSNTIQANAVNGSFTGSYAQQ